jgi:hypothetical protein
MKEVLTDHVKTLVEEWTVKNADKILEFWKEVTDQNIVTYVEKIQSEKSNVQVKKMLENLMFQLNSERQKMGLPSIYL